MKLKLLMPFIGLLVTPSTCPAAACFASAATRTEVADFNTDAIRLHYNTAGTLYMLEVIGKAAAKNKDVALLAEADAYSKLSSFINGEHLKSQIHLIGYSGTINNTEISSSQNKLIPNPEEAPTSSTWLSSSIQTSTAGRIRGLKLIDHCYLDNDSTYIGFFTLKLQDLSSLQMIKLKIVGEK